MPFWLTSCWCCRNTRRGSFVSAFYTLLYYISLSTGLASVLHDEKDYLAGKVPLPTSISILEGDISPTTIAVNIALVICSSAGIICCLLMLYGLVKDKKLFLLPWMFVTALCSIIDVSHILWLSWTTLKFVPVTTNIIIIDMFIELLNIFAVLCVYDQYKEYVAGRGTAWHVNQNREVAVRFTVDPAATATSCLSSRRGAPTTNETRITDSPTQSPTALPNQLSSEDSGVGEQTGRKHVQFIPDAATTTTPLVSFSADEAPAAQLNNERRVSTPPIELLNGLV